MAISFYPGSQASLIEPQRMAFADRPRWKKTVDYAGIELRGVLIQAEIGLLQDGTYGARTPVHEKPGTYRLYTATDLRLTQRQAKQLEIVKDRVREYMNPKVAAISLPIASAAPASTRPRWDTWDASLTTQKVMRDVRSRMMPGTGLWLKGFHRGLSGPYEGFVAAQKKLDEAIARERRPSGGMPQFTSPLESATVEAVLATNRYLRAGGRDFEAAARVQVKELANLVRDLSIAAGTALGGPHAGLMIAGVTRYQDIAQPGPRFYTSSGVQDAISILSTTGALKAGDVAEVLAHGKKVQVAWDIALHCIADVVPEATGQAFKSWLGQKPLGKIQRDALVSAAGASGPSLLNSVITTVMEKVYKIDRGHTLAVSEAIEKMLTRGLVDHAVGKNGRAQVVASRADGQRPSGSLTLFDLLYTEAKHNAPLYGSVPGMHFLRRLQSAAARLDNASLVLPPGGVLRHEGDVAMALLVVMGTQQTLAERQALIRQLTR